MFCHYANLLSVVAYIKPSLVITIMLFHYRILADKLCDIPSKTTNVCLFHVFIYKNAFEDKGKSLQFRR